MKSEQKDIGNRLKEIRKIFNNGYKCSLEQFSELLGESKFNIANYEQGKANIPNRTINALYAIGINPIYIISGEGDKFAPNLKGKDLKEKCSKVQDISIEVFELDDFENMTNEELIDTANKYQSVAGNIIKMLSERKSK